MGEYVLIVILPLKWQVVLRVYTWTCSNFNELLQICQDNKSVRHLLIPAEGPGQVFELPLLPIEICW